MVLQVKGQLLPNLSQACNSSRLRITHMCSCSGKNHSEIHIPCTTFMSGFNALCLQHNNVRASNEQIVLHISDTPEHTVVPLPVCSVPFGQIVLHTTAPLCATFLCAQCPAHPVTHVCTSPTPCKPLCCNLYNTLDSE